MSSKPFILQLFISFILALLAIPAAAYVILIMGVFIDGGLGWGKLGIENNTAMGIGGAIAFVLTFGILLRNAMRERPADIYFTGGSPAPLLAPGLRNILIAAAVGLIGGLLLFSTRR